MPKPFPFQTYFHAEQIFELATHAFTMPAIILNHMFTEKLYGLSVESIEEDYELIVKLAKKIDKKTYWDDVSTDFFIRVVELCKTEDVESELTQKHDSLKITVLESKKYHYMFPLAFKVLKHCVDALIEINNLRRQFTQEQVRYHNSIEIYLKEHAHEIKNLKRNLAAIPEMQPDQTPADIRYDPSEAARLARIKLNQEAAESKYQEDVAKIAHDIVNIDQEIESLKRARASKHKIELLENNKSQLVRIKKNLETSLLEYSDASSADVDGQDEYKGLRRITIHELRFLREMCIDTDKKNLSQKFDDTWYIKNTFNYRLPPEPLCGKLNQLKETLEKLLLLVMEDIEAHLEIFNMASIPERDSGAMTTIITYMTRKLLEMGKLINKHKRELRSTSDFSHSSYAKQLEYWVVAYNNALKLREIYPTVQDGYMTFWLTIKQSLKSELKYFADTVKLLARNCEDFIYRLFIKDEISFRHPREKYQDQIEPLDKKNTLEYMFWRYYNNQPIFELRVRDEIMGCQRFIIDILSNCRKLRNASKTLSSRDPFDDHTDPNRVKLIRLLLEAFAEADEHSKNSNPRTSTDIYYVAMRDIKDAITQSKKTGLRGLFTDLGRNLPSTFASLKRPIHISTLGYPSLTLQKVETLECKSYFDKADKCIEEAYFIILTEIGKFKAIYKDVKRFIPNK